MTEKADAAHRRTEARDERAGDTPAFRREPKLRDLSREAGRLLIELGQGRAAIDAFEADAIVTVGANSRGVSLSGRRFPLSAAASLTAADLAAWDETGRRRRLVISAAGLARLRREAAPDGHDFLAQHRDLGMRIIEDPHGGRASVLVDTAESPLAWLRRRKDAAGKPLIGAAAFAAGERFRADLTLARALPRVTADWSGIGAAGHARSPSTEAMLDRVVAARQRVDKAARAVGADLAGLLIDVCGFLKGLDEVERDRGWPARSAKVVLGIALARLAAHYGYADEAQGRARASAILTWTA